MDTKMDDAYDAACDLCTVAGPPPVTTDNPKDAYGDLKPAVDLVPAALVLYASQAFKIGAIKYGAFNWREKKVRMRVYLAAIERHLKQFSEGEDLEWDEKAQKWMHHLAAIAACTGILVDAIELGMIVDDRVKGPAPELVRRLARDGGFKP